MLDPNNDFNAPCYDDIWDRDRVFEEEFGVVDEYFITLQYYIMREAYQSRRGQPLNLNICYYDDGGGQEEIFRDVSVAEKETWANRNYVVVEESIDTQTSKFGDIYHVTETYGYVPNRSFVNYESLLANSFTWVKAENRSVGNVNYSLNWGCFYIQDSGNLAVGDEVTFMMEWKYANGQTSGIAYLQPSTVFAVNGTYAFANATGGRFYHVNGQFADIDSSLFAWWAKYPNGYMTINNIQFTKYKSFTAYTRAKKKLASQVVSLGKHVTKFSFEAPTDLQSAYCPRNSDGSIAEAFSERSIPSVSTHLTNVANRKEVLLEDERIEPQLWHGLYKRTATYVPCK